MSIRKKMLRALLVTALLVALCGAAMALTYPFLSTTTDSVRMRRSASGSATVLETIPAGAQVEVLGKTGGYYQVLYNNRKGYVQTKYVSTEKDQMVQITAVPREVVGEYPYTTVTLEKVNLRASRSVRGELLKKIPKGAEISVLSNGQTWAEVEYAGIRGYVKNEFITLKDVKKVKVTPTPTPVPTLSPEESEAEYVILERGSEGAEVKALQNALIQLGYLKGTADGKFGAATENAVLLFQQANGYPTTGVMDANTQAFLYSGKPKNASGKKEEVTQVSPVTGATMKQHDTGDEVAELQRRLQTLGFYDGEVSGTFNLATRKAVIAFQKKNNLTADGVADAATQKKLWSLEALSVSDTPTPAPTPTPSPEPTYIIPDTTVRRNDSGADAKAVQKRLKELGYFKGTVDGKFTAASVSALKAFQEDHGLEADGVAGKGTYAVLFSNQALKKGTTPTPVPEETPVPGEEESGIPVDASYETLRKGTSSSDVAYLQQVLINLGYLTGEPDGNYGTQTEMAVKAFQKNNQLGVDGTAGTQTLTLLYSSEASPAPTVDPKKAAAATPTPEPTNNLKKGTSGSAVKTMQQQLIKLGYLTGKADGIFGTSTYQALVAFQKANKLTADGVAGSKTLTTLSSGSAVAASSGADQTKAAATATEAPTKVAAAPTGAPTASRVQYANWYTTVKDICKKYPYATVYDYKTGISWQVHIFSVGSHADYEPLTAADTSKMLKVFGGNTWNARAVWVLFANGSVYMATTHSMPHGVIHITDNNFEGHSCLHFPRTQAQVESIGVYATSHQAAADAGWAETQAMK
ncbi:MAG: peptidoglycan-binding protein [Clostridia bacterium]|nr:peptidoglycan-binding protein [Clostridia bacterium]